MPFSLKIWGKCVPSGIVQGLDNGEDGKAKSVVDGAEEASAVSSDVIILDVGGMTRGGCAASVKRILENQLQVSAASVNLITETAIVWPVSEAKAVPNWQKELGETLAKHLTNCGFKSNPREQLEKLLLFAGAKVSSVASLLFCSLGGQICLISPLMCELRTLAKRFNCLMSVNALFNVLV
ncbi:hypothetical protein BT93_G0648 [Corymbia citriodora subsp. variegata]|nr:hypothetical protein BT93_G0648 [Corymbia citriodora subsp. variegata]